MATVNQEICKKIGEFLRPIKLLAPVVRSHGKDNEEKLFFLIIFSGISHSINFDFLEKALTKIQSEHPEKFNPEYMEKIKDEELYDWLKDYPKKERIKIETRAPFVRDICKKLNKVHDGKVYDIIETSNFDVPIIYKSLDIFDAYNEDPLKKKSTVFISELINSGIIKLKNKEKILIKTDYHIIRLILRTGLLDLTTEEKKTLEDHSSVDIHFTNNIRSLCSDAITSVAKHAYKYPTDIETLFWHIGRSCCDSSEPGCETCESTKCEIPVAGKVQSDKCLISPVCLSFEKKELRNLLEPNFETTFY